MAKRYTVDDVMKWNPCYKREEVIELFGRRRSVTLVDMLSSAKLDDSDAIWCACRAMGDRQRRLFACDCAESVVHLATDPRVAECIAVARRYADGLATGEELRTARAAADDAYAYAADAARAAAAYAADAADDDAAYVAYAAGRETQRNALLMLALAGEIQ